MRCKGVPDLGAGTGLSYYTWNKDTLYRTKFSYTCKKGQAFENIWQRTVETWCDFQNKGDTIITWRFSASNKLTKCVRKYKVFHSYNIM